jgi:hypothetical protein
MVGIVENAIEIKKSFVMVIELGRTGRLSQDVGERNNALSKDVSDCCCGLCRGFVVGL